MPADPALRGEQAVRALERAGFKVARISASHRIMRHPDGRGTTVPVHPAAIWPREPCGILADIGMTVGEPQELL